MSSPEGQMPDYGEILQFLARNPPQIPSERQLHASLLELLANCLREEATAVWNGPGKPATRRETGGARMYHRWMHFN